MLKGHTKIELTDVNTGEKTVVEEDNLVTNAVQYLLAFMNKINRAPSNEILPIATKALGGLMLFNKPLAEDANNIGFPSTASLVGYAGQNANTEDTMRGSLNSAESGATALGYVNVWDFSTSQANGTIQCVCLTSAYGGTNPILRQSNGDLSGQVRYEDAYQNMHVMAIKGDYMYFRYRGDRTVKKGRFAPYGIRVEEYWYGGNDLGAEYVTTLPSEWQTDPAYYDNGHDGYVYYITKTDAGNTYGANSKGDAVINIIKIRYSDESWEIGAEQVVTLEKCYLTERSSERNAISGGYLFWISYDRKGVYIINLSNFADIQLIKVGNEENLNVYYLEPSFDGGVALQFSFKEGNDSRTRCALLYSNGDLVRCSVNGEMACRHTKFNRDGKIAYAGNFEGYYYDSNDRVGYRLQAPYLGTINNLSSPVVKSPTQTMKVTYTLNNIEEA